VIDWESADVWLRRHLWGFVPGLVLLALAGWFHFLLDLIVALLLASFVYLSFLLLRGVWSGVREDDHKPRQPDD
jgi:hypothetical protein